MEIYTNWTKNGDIIKYVLKLRDEGMSYANIGQAVRKKFGYNMSRHQARHVASSYGPDDEFDEEHRGKAIIKARRSQNAARIANKSVRDISDMVLTQEAALDAIKDIVKHIDASKHKPATLKRTTKGMPMTVELLFSDWQIGKHMKGYDKDIAVKRLQEYTSAAVNEIKRKTNEGFKVEKIVLVLLGDIIESAEKATKKNSARSVDSSTAEQLEMSIKHMFLDLIKPLTDLGIEIDVVAVTGNHDHIHDGMVYYNPGKEHLTWTIYKALELLSKECKLHVNFDIPEGYFATYDFYGQTALYEHGYGLAATEQALNNRRNERMRQKKEYIHYFRMGDKHNICRFNDDSLVVNGAFFGNDDTGSEYSSISGYSSIASQLMFFHIPREDARKTIYDSFSIQLHHIK